MKKIIDKEYIRDNIAQLMLGTADNTIVMDDKEILLLKIAGKVIINKYLNHLKRNDFPYSDTPMHVSEGVELYNILFEMDKDYLVYELGGLEDSVIMNSFSKMGDNCLWNHGVASDVSEDDFDVLSHTREEVEKIFDCHNYDVMFVLDKRGEVLIAYSKEDGEIIKKDMLPTSDEEFEVHGKPAIIYGGFTMEHIMITVKDGIFRVMNFSLTLDKDGTYVMDKQEIHLPKLSNVDMGEEEYEKTRSVSI